MPGAAEAFRPAATSSATRSKRPTTTSTSETRIGGGAPVKLPTSCDPLARSAQTRGRRDERDRGSDLDARVAVLRNEIGDARPRPCERSELRALGGGLVGCRRGAQRDAERRGQQGRCRAVEVRERRSQMGLRPSRPEHRSGHERHGRSRDHVHQPDFPRAPPLGLDEVHRQHDERGERRLPHREWQGSTRVGGDEDQGREDDPGGGVRGPDDPEDRDRGQEASRRSADCCDRGSFAGEHTRAQDGERAERDPETVREVADARDEHREADGRTCP